MRWLVLGIVLSFSTGAWANFADAPLDTPAPDARQQAAETDTHPVLSADATWAGSMVIVVAGLFLAAWVVGPIVRAEAAEAVPVSAGHDDHASAHHYH